MAYTQQDFLNEVEVLGFVQASTNAIMSMLPVGKPTKSGPKGPGKPELSASQGATKWMLENLEPTKPDKSK